MVYQRGQGETLGNGNVNVFKNATAMPKSGLVTYRYKNIAGYHGGRRFAIPAIVVSITPPLSPPSSFFR